MNFRLINIFAALAVTVTSFAGTPQWAPVGDNIKTSWAETVDPACPLPEYPRPQMVRSEWLNLNGLWNYGVTDGQTSTFEAEGKILVLCGDILDVHHYPCPAMNTFEAKFANVIGEYGGIGYPIEGHLWKVDYKWGYGDVMKNGGEVLDLYDEYAKMLEDFVKVGCTGAVYTQTTDVEGEVNGMITYDRKVVKIDVARLREINERVIKTMAK